MSDGNGFVLKNCRHNYTAISQDNVGLVVDKLTHLLPV